MKTMTASHATGKGRPDPSFSSAGNAKAAIAEFGKENVIDATLGVLKDDKGDFQTMKAVEECYRNLPGNELMDYAPIEGLKEFLDASIDYIFQGHRPANTYSTAVATPGGTGGIHHMIFNYVEYGQQFLIPNWHWGPYREIATENGRAWDLYEMFGPDGKFSLADLKEKTAKLLKVQDSVMTIFNTPAHNPSGYTMSDADWKEIMDYYRACAKDAGKKIIVLWDMAYMDYAGDPDELRTFLRNFEDLPENILIAIAFSMSKSFLIYGMRSGALACLSSSKEIAEEFQQVNTFSNRATWSNGSRGAQRLLIEVMADKNLKKKIDEERLIYKAMLEKRAAIFVKEAKEEGLNILPYEAGFFITLPAKDTAGLAAKLAKKNIFVIPLAKAIRFAVSAVPTCQVPGLARKVKDVFAGHEV
jgi:aromatic-amino-acid transaminase